MHVQTRHLAQCQGIRYDSREAHLLYKRMPRRCSVITCKTYVQLTCRCHTAGSSDIWRMGDLCILYWTPYSWWCFPMYRPRITPLGHVSNPWCPTLSSPNLPSTSLSLPLSFSFNLSSWSLSLPVSFSTQSSPHFSPLPTSAANSLRSGRIPSLLC